jgi:hypothetical protein
LFADLKGSTALIEGLDPEEARTILNPALQLMMDAVHQYDGFVAQALGDGIFALFGALIAHEDHPQRAVYAALRMQDAMRRYGAPLYPEPLRAVFGAGPHQICEFHILKELTKAVLREVAQVRKHLAARKPTVKRGRPSTPTAKRIVRQRARMQQKIAALFASRYLFVQHDLTAAERRTLRDITRGLPALRTLRAVMEEVYRLFDRRCRMDTALVKLATLRQRVRRCKHVGTVLRKLQSPNLEKALTFLDDKLLPSTSNAVERSNRRHRKMQKTVYRVRTQELITNRIALDMLRDSQKQGRTDTLQVLHRKRVA